MFLVWGVNDFHGKVVLKLDAKFGLFINIGILFMKDRPFFSKFEFFACKYPLA